METDKPKKMRRKRKPSIDWDTFNHPESYRKKFEMAVDAPTTDENKVLPSTSRVTVELVGGINRKQEENDEAFQYSTKTLSRMASSMASAYLETGKMFDCDESAKVVNDDGENENKDDGKEKEGKFVDSVVQTVKSIQQKRKAKLEKHWAKLDKKRKKRIRRHSARQSRLDGDDENENDDDGSSDNEDDSSSEENFSHQESSDSPSESEKESDDDDVETATISMTFARKVVGKRTAEELRKKMERAENRKKRKERQKMWIQTDYHKIDNPDIDEMDENYDDPFIDRNGKYEFAAHHFIRELQCLKKEEMDGNLIAFRKTFLLYQVLNQLLYLKSNIYNRLKPGLYWCFNIITKKQMLKADYSLWIRRFPFAQQDWVMLTYDVRNKEFFLLLPSQPTRQPVNEIRKSKVLDDDNVFITMQKDTDVWQSWNHPKPDWQLTAIEEVYPPYYQFIVYQCSKFLDANVGKVTDIKASTPEMYAAFVQRVESELKNNDVRNLLKYEGVHYSQESKMMVDNPKYYPSVWKDWHF